MFETIDKFSMQAPNLQLQEILESIKKGYEDQNSQYKGKLERIDKKKKNPQEFEAEINRINNALSRYKKLMRKTNKDLGQSYRGIHSERIKIIEKLKLKYPELITKSDDLEIVRKYFIDAMNEIDSIRAGFSSSLTTELSKKA